MTATTFTFLPPVVLWWRNDSDQAAFGWSAGFYGAGLDPIAANRLSVYGLPSENSPTPLANPVPFDTQGKLTACLGTQGYKLVIWKGLDESAVAAFTMDNIIGGNGYGPGFGCQFVDTIAALKALGAGSSLYVMVGGYYAAKDGGGGLFRWNASDAVSDDAGYTISPNSAPLDGRWQRIPDDTSYVRADAFGCVASDTVNRTTALLAADAYAAANAKTLLVANDSYSGDATYSQKIILSGTNTLTSPVKCSGRVIFTSNGSSSTLNFPILFESSPLSIFATDITIGLTGKGQVIYPEWFGAVGAGQDSTAAMNACFVASQAAGQTIKMTQPYQVQGSLTLSYVQAQTLECSNGGGFLLNADTTFVGGGNLSCYDLKIVGGAYQSIFQLSGEANFIGGSFSATVGSGKVGFGFPEGQCSFFGSLFAGTQGGATSKLIEAASGAILGLYGCQFTQSGGVNYGVSATGGGTIVKIVSPNSQSFATANTIAASSGVIDSFIYAANGVIPGNVEVGGSFKADAGDITAGATAATAGRSISRAGTGTKQFAAAGRLIEDQALYTVASNTSQPALLSSLSIPANTLLNVGDSLEISYDGNLISDSDTLADKFNFNFAQGGTTILGMPEIDVLDNSSTVYSWTLNIKVVLIASGLVWLRGHISLYQPPSYAGGPHIFNMPSGYPGGWDATKILPADFDVVVPSISFTTASLQALRLYIDMTHPNSGVSQVSQNMALVTFYPAPI